MGRTDLSIAIIGGGIGGLAAALSLLRAGLDVHVYERARTLSEVGAGIQVSPNASRILHRLGLADSLADLGVKPLAWHQRRWDDGRTLLRAPLAEPVEAAFGFPHYQMHRADVLATLVRALPPERLHAGHRFTALVDHGDHVEAEFENGTHISVDALVGADGIHSAVRHVLFGPEEPHFTGCVAYRGLVPADRLAHLDLEVTAQVWMGPGKHFVHYYVQSRRMVNFVAITDRDTWTRESWTDRGEVADALAAYEGWHPQVRSILGAVDETFIWALFDRKPMTRWSVGRVTLLGDACHAMLPFMAQGAAQAIEDGATLAVCLSRIDARDVPNALRRYEALRLPRASRVQGLSEANKTRFHLPDGAAQQARDAEMARGATDWSLKAVAWLYGYDAGEPERTPAD
jgi:2-polyprenyl-6-methoxyphenol hydroxylase-like FAD-dependent oxidoreductase